MGALDKRWRLICYDVRDPARWRKLYRVMRGHGHAVQYSVFRCRLDARELERLRWEIAKILTDEDRILFVELCPGCADNVTSRGHIDDWDVQQPSFVILDGSEPDQGSVRVGLPKGQARGNVSKARKKRARAVESDP